MAVASEEGLVAVFRRTGGFVALGIVTGVEFTQRAFDEFALLHRAQLEVIPSLWALVPAGIREEFIAALQRSVAPGFRYHTVDGLRRSEEEQRRHAERRTARVQAWAAGFIRFLAEVELSAEPGAAPDPAM